jgi:hypothetical protein
VNSFYDLLMSIIFNKAGGLTIIGWSGLSIGWMIGLLLFFVGAVYLVYGEDAFEGHAKAPKASKWDGPILILMWGIWLGGPIVFYLWKSTPMHFLMLGGIGAGAAVFCAGKTANVTGRPLFFILFAIFSGLAWYTWPAPKEYAMAAATAVRKDLASALSMEWFKPAEAITLATGQAELQRSLEKWKKSEFLMMTDFVDVHHGLGFQLKSYSVGPGREVESGVFEFRVQLEVSKFQTYPLENQAFFPDKTYTVIHSPKAKKFTFVGTGGMTNEDAITQQLSQATDFQKDVLIGSRKLQ